jgi:hypothetical protein
MLRVLVRWFPGRTFVCTADGNYASHGLAELAAPVGVSKVGGIFVQRGENGLVA